MKGALLALCLVAVIVAPREARSAQDANALEVSRCLTPAAAERGEPEYPADARRAGEEGSVGVELTFTGPDVPPAVNVILSSGSPSLDAAVTQYVSRLRAPCMRAGQLPVLARQQFVFHLDRSHDAMAATRLDLQAQDNREINRCIGRVDGQARPKYPVQEAQGTVLAQVLFTAANTEPRVTIVAPAASEPLNDAVKAFMRGYRLSCMGEGPVRAEQLFRFHGSSRPAHLEAKLAEFLHLVRKDQMGTVAFDLNGMSCPFKAVIEYWEPFRRNKVDEVGDAVPSRRPFLDWLASLRVNAYPGIETLMQADRITISVPCGKIDP